MVPRSSVGSAVALNSIGFNLSRSLGPAVGGVIVASAAGAAALAVNAVSYLGHDHGADRLEAGRRLPTGLPREAVGTGAMFAGVRYIALSPQLGRVLVRAFLFGFSAVSVLALLPVVASADFRDGGPLVYGLLLGCLRPRRRRRGTDQRRGSPSAFPARPSSASPLSASPSAPP